MNAATHAVVEAYLAGYRHALWLAAQRVDELDATWQPIQRPTWEQQVAKRARRPDGDEQPDFPGGLPTPPQFLGKSNEYDYTTPRPDLDWDIDTSHLRAKADRWARDVNGMRPASWDETHAWVSARVWGRIWFDLSDRTRATIRHLDPAGRATPRRAA